MNDQQAKGIGLGGLWLNKDEQGNVKHMSGKLTQRAVEALSAAARQHGTLEGMKIMIFRNKWQEKPNDPDYKIVLYPQDQPQQGQGYGGSPHAGYQQPPASNQGYQQPQNPPQAPPAAPTNDDVPF